MKLISLIEKIDSFYAKGNEISLAETVTLYKLTPHLKYDKEFLKTAIKNVKTTEKKIKTAKKLLESFSKYFEEKAKIYDFIMPSSDGILKFNKKAGVFEIQITEKTLKEIANVLKERGVTDEKGFFKTFEKKPLNAVYLFVEEIKKELIDKWNLLHKNLSKKEIERAEKILKIKFKRNSEGDFVKEAEEIIEKVIENINESLKK